jgi:HK97 family phage prohead protease
MFNAETVIGGGMWGFREVILPGAFDEAIESDDVRALFNHNPDILLGRTASKTLRLKADAKGLHYDVDLPDTAAARDVRTLVKRGDVSGSSFAFRVQQDEDEQWDYSDVKAGKLPLRKILRASLYDVSPVTYRRRRPSRLRWSRPGRRLRSRGRRRSDGVGRAAVFGVHPRRTLQQDFVQVHARRGDVGRGNRRAV